MSDRAQSPEPAAPSRGSPLTLTAVLFAGGQSRRMGSDKATLPWKGRPLWAHQLQTLRALAPAAVWISARLDPAWRPADVGIVLDDSPSRGPLAGLAASLQRLQTSHLLALAIDVPQMSTEHLRKLWSLAGPSFGIIPARAQTLEPLCAIYPIEAASLAGPLAAEPDHSLRALARRLLQQGRLQVYPVAETESALYHNVNTPADIPGQSAS